MWLMPTSKAYTNLIPSGGAYPKHLLKTLKENEWRVIYFDAPNRGEQVRLLFHLANIPFEDYRMSFPHGKTPLMSLKAGDASPMAFDLCPIVQHGPDVSIGIVPGCMLYVGEHFNLGPTSLKQRALCAGLVDASEMMRDDIFYGNPIGFFNRAKVRKKLKETGELLNHEVYHKWLGHFERFLRNKNSEPLLQPYIPGPFFLGATVSYVDCSIYDALMGIWAMELYDLDLNKRKVRYPLINAFIDKFSNIPSIKKYETERGTRIKIYRKAEDASNKRYAEKMKKRGKL